MNFKKTAIFITLFSLWLTNYFSGEDQLYVAFFLIFSIGILHGSNDLAIMNKLSKAPGWKEVLISLGVYVLTVIVAGTLFYYLPELALAGFILFSGYHFGEQHWNKYFGQMAPPLKYTMFSGYGLLVLFGLFYLNSAETTAIIKALTGFEVLKSWYLWGTLLSGGITLGLISYGHWRKLLSNSQLFVELFLLAVFGIVFNYANLIWAFAIYFIYWHSIPSIFEQLGYLYGEVSIKTFIKYLRSSSLIWVVSTGSIFLLFYLMRDQEALILPLFFAFLGAITFAHSFIISKMFAAGGSGDY